MKDSDLPNPFGDHEGHSCMLDTRMAKGTARKLQLAGHTYDSRFDNLKPKSSGLEGLEI